MGGPMRCGAGSAPEGALAHGKVEEATAVGNAIRQLLARTEITSNRPLVAVSDTLATFRVLDFPPAATDQEIGAAISKELALDPERIATRWVEVGGHDARMVYAAAWDRATVRGITDALKTAGLEPAAMELKSASVARAVMEPSCVVLDLVAEPAEIVLIDGGVPQQWHAFELSSTEPGDLPQQLAAPLRSVIRFHQRRRGNTFGPTSPVLVSTEQVLPPHVVLGVQDLVGHPVRMLGVPPRVPPNVRHATYLTCLGLIMRRES